MNIDMEKIRKIYIKKNKDIKSKLNNEEIDFIKFIYNNIVESDCYESMTHYLAGIYELSISDVKMLKNIYYNYFATKEEKNLYIDKNTQPSKSSGFANISIITSVLVLISSLGIFVAFILYNL